MRRRYLLTVALGLLLLSVCRVQALTAIELALWEAVQTGNEKWTADLLAQGANVNARNNFGTTALMLAAMKGHTKIVKLLLEKGADVRAAEKDGFTGLQWASKKGHKDVVAILQARLTEVPEVVKSLKFEKKIEISDIPPLYSEPKLPGEGGWQWEDMPRGENGQPIVYRTLYRPSSKFPHAIVHMLLFDMRHVSVRLYLGSSEPGGNKYGSKVEQSKHPFLLAVTNALWQTRHAGRGGIIYHGKVLKKMAKGVATIVVFKDGKVDILEWNDEIPVAEVQDARQLKHLIAKDGKVVTSLMKRGKEVSSEIGLGSLLNEDRPVVKKPADKKNSKTQWALNLTSGPRWFLATRSAFGIREDGNLVYALGHHIGTKDLAKALVLAGCVRAIHGDANPGNAVGIVYYTDESGKIVKMVGLSPDQHPCTLNRYLDHPYPKDFFAFFRRKGLNEQLSTSRTPPR